MLSIPNATLSEPTDLVVTPRRSQELRRYVRQIRSFP
jgi:hypothetical protein